jgi:hypothetical protein
MLGPDGDNIRPDNAIALARRRNESRVLRLMRMIIAACQWSTLNASDLAHDGVRSDTIVVKQTSIFGGLHAGRHLSFPDVH